MAFVDFYTRRTKKGQESSWSLKRYGLNSSVTIYQTCTLFEGEFLAPEWRMRDQFRGLHEHDESTRAQSLAPVSPPIDALRF